MQIIWHKELAKEPWFKLTLMEQLGNIGSEVGRAIIRQRKGDVEQRDKALERALELFDLTLADSRLRHRLKEITRAREIVCDVFYGENQYNVTLESLDRYFNQFAYAARLEHEIRNP